MLVDLGPLGRVIANVVHDALRHGHPSPVAIRASRHGSVVEPRVVHHGTGPQKQAGGKVFAPFHRLGERDATPGGGLTVTSLPAAISLPAYVEKP
ncbi:ATP-binding protein [Lentzea sp. NPDC005914]|uniref:ATP-binding protein n=1 Tax=Lentzea sp. NPDC005914 TaxID=3154572 RepID=UPI0033ED5A5C